MRIGDFGTEPDPVSEEHTFGWFGTDIRVNADGATDLAFVDFIEKAMEIDEEDPQSAMVVKSYMRQMVHPDDFDEFWRLAREHQQTTEGMMTLAAEVVAAVVGRPSKPSSDSPDGPSPIGTSSQDGSYSRAIRRFDGRPDLQLVLVRAEEARERKSA